MTLYTVIDTIDHNGTRYTTGEDVDLSATAAKILIPLGVIAAKPKVPEKPDKPDKKD